MANDCPHIEDEIEGHKTNLNSWISAIEAAPVVTSRVGVNQRFVEDCRTLISNLDKAEEPSSADLTDFDDRTKALEVQFNNITDNGQ